MSTRAFPLSLSAVFTLAWSISTSGLPVPNHSFEAGIDSPAGWSVSGGVHEWLAADAADGKRAIAVTGNGNDTNHWRSDALAFKPSSLYRISFSARRVAGTDGTAVTGALFCNRDIRGIGGSWQRFSSIVFSPRRISDDNGGLRFGQWHFDGTVAYDDIVIADAAPVYARLGSIKLGAGEQVSGNEYVFSTPFDSESRNHSRPLESAQCHFNTNRWVFGSDDDVVYRHRITGRKFLEASVDADIRWYRSGELLVEVSRDGEAWRAIGTRSQTGGVSGAVPRDLFPADEVWVRFSARARKKVGADSDPGSLQVGSYALRATIDGAPVELKGETRFAVVRDESADLDVAVVDIGDCLPGGANVLKARVTNAGNKTLLLQPAVEVMHAGKTTRCPGKPLAARPGVTTDTEVPYDIPGTGEIGVRLSLGADIAYQWESDVVVPDFYATSYGEILPGSGDTVGLWWANSGWKIPRTRSLPSTTGTGLQIAAARNEAEAAQLVVRPTRDLTGLSISTSDLTGPAGAAISADHVEILRVGYVSVTRPTDRTGIATDWPDPLPPMVGAMDLAAGENQPFWVRVRVPRAAKAGEYAGNLVLHAKGYQATVPLRVTVFDFDLPDRMTCQTAFGVRTNFIWQYHGVTDSSQRRLLLDKYWANYSAHHISPYDPAPLDPLPVEWPTEGLWDGDGSPDLEEKHGGQASRCIVDDAPKANRAVRYPHPIDIPEGGLRLSFWYKTKEPGGKILVTLNHHDAEGQWMPYRNNDMRLEGSGQWQRFERLVTEFPEGAKSIRLTLWATWYSEDGANLGTVWYDDVSLRNAQTGEELLENGGFEPVELTDLTPVFDWEAWDAAMTRAIDHYHFNTFRLRMQGMGGGTFHARYEPRLLGFGEETPHYKAAFRGYVGQLGTHLREKGWLDEAFVYWFDEPAPPDYEFVMNGFRKLKENAPGLRRMLTEQVEDALVGGPDLWCPVSSHYDHDRAEERRKAGEHFWWYVCTGPKAPFCTLFIDHPGTEMRVWLWQTWQRKIEGILVWQTNYWTSGAAYPDPEHPQNPYDDPMGWVQGYDTESGTKRPWGNGDGRFVYPPEAAADAHPAAPVLEGPVDSIRWEMLRDGIEDYEYLAMLQRLLAVRSDRLPATERQAIEELLTVPEAISVSMTEFTTDPALVEARRRQVAAAIERLRRK